MQENKNILLKTTLKLIVGGTRKDKDYNCVTELKPFEKHIKEVGSYPGEYYYLLARAYAHQGNKVEALENLRIARDAEVVDQKVTHI